MIEQGNCDDVVIFPRPPMLESGPNAASETIPIPSPPKNPSSPTSPCKGKWKLTSDAWKDFKKAKNNNGVAIGICNHCNCRIRADKGTKGMLEYLKRCLKKKNTDIKQQVLEAEKKLDGKVRFGNFEFDQEVSRMELAQAIILHEYPLSMVEHIGFKKFIKSLQPLFKCVCRNTIKSDIFKIYEQAKKKTHKMLEKLKSRVAITTDMWTSNQKRGFMAVTAHFIDDSWTLQSQLLRFAYVPCPHTAEVISDVLVCSLLDWNVDRKVSTITIDNCSTNDAMIDVVVDKLCSSGSLLLDGRMLHMRCCAHILNLIVKEGLDCIGSAIESIRDSVHFWTATQSRTEKFGEAARVLHIQSTKKLVLDCKTRWNSTYLMLSTAIIYKDVFARAKQKERLCKVLPSDKDWKIAQEICEKLKVFYNITELFSGTKYPTSNCYFPKICEVRQHLTGWMLDNSTTIQKMAEKMMEKFEKYWSNCHTIMAVAVVLDPRYKMKIVDYFFSIIYGCEAQIEIDKVRDACYELLMEYQIKAKGDQEREDIFDKNLTPSQSSNGGEVDQLSQFDLFVSSTSKTVTTKSEMDHYLEENVLPRTSEFDVLNWWKTNGIKYPTLQQIARDLLAIPVSSVASESAFSTGGRVVSSQRNRLHFDTLEALMCAQDWLWSKMNGDGSMEKSNCMRSSFNDEAD